MTNTIEWEKLSPRGLAILRLIAIPISNGWSEREVARGLLTTYALLGLGPDGRAPSRARTAVVARAGEILRWHPGRHHRAFPAPVSQMTGLVERKRLNHVTLEGAYGIRTRAAAVRGRCPRPLDECAEWRRQCSADSGTAASGSSSQAVSGSGSAHWSCLPSPAHGRTVIGRAATHKRRVLSRRL
jgi:hypothetical protein